MTACARPMRRPGIPATKRIRAHQARHPRNNPAMPPSQELRPPPAPIHSAPVPDAAPGTQQPQAAPALPRADPPSFHRNPEFLRLWVVGMLVSLVRWLEILAFAVFAYERTQSALWVASLMMLRLLPTALFGLAFGMLVTRVSRRTVMVVTHLALFLTSAALLGLSSLGAVQIWHLGLASVVNGLVWAGDMVTRRSLIGDIVGPARMAQAMSLDAVASHACRLIGPALGGVLIARGGLVAVFVFTTLLYVPVLVALFGLGPHPAPPAQTPFALRSWLAGGVRAARDSAMLRASLWLTVLFNLFAWPAVSMVPVIGRERLKLGTEGVGVLASVDGVGALLASMALIVVARRLHQGAMFLLSIVVFLLLQAVFAWSPLAWVTGLALLTMGASQALLGVMQSTLVYVAVPAHQRAEAMGLMTLCIGTAPVGFFAIGALAERIGASGALLAFALAGLATVGLTWPLCRACLQEPVRG
jgi:MFS family permease